MTALDGALALVAVGGWALLALALYDRGRKQERIGELETAAANARADAEKNRADVAERQVSAALAAKKEAEADADALTENALKNDGVIDPTATWDARSDASGPVRGVVSGVLPSPAAGAGARGDTAPVPDRRSDGAPREPLAGADTVPARRS